MNLDGLTFKLRRRIKELKMSKISAVADYSEEGFAILEDDAGKFLAFKDNPETLDLEGYEPGLYSPRQSKNRILDSQTLNH
jgi:hypothetical protein